MIKEFDEILIVDQNDLAQTARNHCRQWVFRILKHRGADLSAAARLYPESAEIPLRAWSDFLIRNNLDIIYDLGASELRAYELAERMVLGSWREPVPVRSKSHRPGQITVIFCYSEPV